MEEKNELLTIYENCVKARYLDVELGKLRQKEKLTLTLFRGLGSELGPGIVAALLKRGDYLIPRYRGFAALIGKGLAIEQIVGEVFGKKSGTAGGLGDVTPFHAPSCGIPGYTISLGASFPLAVGMSLAVNFKKEDKIVAHLFGDGEASRPAFGAALNMASLWNLPLLFVCENNGVSMNNRMNEMSSTKTIAERARGYNLAAETIPDTEPLLLYRRTREIIAGVRETKRPFLLEIIQKRFVPHSTQYEDGLIDDSAIPEKEDPLHIFENALLECGISAHVLKLCRERIHASIAETIKRTERNDEISKEEFLSIYYDE